MRREPLKKITKAEIIKEGCPDPNRAFKWFIGLWNDIYRGTENTFERNPLVDVIEFDRIWPASPFEWKTQGEIERKK